jgi:hypothetical protein
LRFLRGILVAPKIEDSLLKLNASRRIVPSGWQLNTPKRCKRDFKQGGAIQWQRNMKHGIPINAPYAAKNSIRKNGCKII